MIRVFLFEIYYLFIGQELPPARGHGQVSDQTKAIALVQVDVDAVSVPLLNFQGRDGPGHTLGSSM
jgi:hypothetical protein